MKKFSKDNIKYFFFANSRYAINGLKEVVLNETSLKIELTISIEPFPLTLIMEIAPSPTGVAKAVIISLFVKFIIRYF